MMKNRWNPNAVKAVKALAFGILLSYAFANIILSSQWQAERILAAGQVCEFPESALKKGNGAWAYDDETDMYAINSGDAVKRFPKWNESVDWKCLYVKLQNLSKDTSSWILQEYDDDNQYVGQQEIKVKNGENWIALNPAGPFRRFYIQIAGEDGLRFRIARMVLLEEIPRKKTGALLWAALFACWICFYFALRGKCSVGKRVAGFLDKMWGFLQFCYESIVNYEGFGFGRTWSRMKKNRIRTAMFFFMAVYMITAYNYDLYAGQAYFKYHSLMIGIVLFAAALISREGNFEGERWDSPAAYYWLTFWLLACVSDFVISKRFHFAGYVMLFAAGFFIFVWKSMNHPNDILWNYLHAMELVAVLGVIYNVCFRLKYDALLYNGYMKSASDFGVLSAFLFLVFLADAYECHKKGSYGKKAAFCVCGMACMAFQALASGKKSAVAYIIIVVAVVFACAAKSVLALSAADKKKIAGYAVLACVLVVGYYFSVKRIPWMLHTMAGYKGEIFESGKDRAIIGKLAESGIAAYQNVQYTSFGQKILIWKSYLREMNFFGHALPDLRVWNKQRAADNQLLQILYRYGMLACIPYVALFWEGLKLSVKALKDTWKDVNGINILFAGFFLYWWLLGAFGSLEYPYYQPAWLLAYLMLGRYFQDEGKQIEG